MPPESPVCQHTEAAETTEFAAELARVICKSSSCREPLHIATHTTQDMACYLDLQDALRLSQYVADMEDLLGRLHDALLEDGAASRTVEALAAELVTRRTWKLTPGPHHAGPLDGQVHRRSEDYPVLWVYSWPNGETAVWEDEYDTEFRDGEPYQKRLKYGPPYSGARAATTCHKNSLNSWHLCRRARQSFPSLAGFYVPAEDSSREMYWITPAELLDGLVCVHTAPTTIHYTDEE